MPIPTADSTSHIKRFDSHLELSMVKTKFCTSSLPATQALTQCSVSINYTTQLLMPKNFDVVYFTLNIQAISKSCQLYLPHMLLWPLLSAFPTSTLLQVPSCLVWNNALASQLFPLLPALYPTVYSPHSSWVLRSLITNKSDQITPLGKTFHHLQITLGPGRCGPWLPLWPNFLPLFPPQGLHSSHTDLADP